MRTSPIPSSWLTHLKGRKGSHGETALNGANTREYLIDENDDERGFHKSGRRCLAEALIPLIVVGRAAAKWIMVVRDLIS